MIQELMRSRRSIRRFRPEPVDRETLLALIEAATTAPSAGNRQPWRFVIVTDEEMRGRIRDVARTALDRISASVDERVEGAFRRYAEHFTAFDTAQVLIVPLWKRARLLTEMVEGRVADEDRMTIDLNERNDAVVSASLAVQNLLLAAHARGLGATVMTGPLLAGAALREVLGVRPGWEVLAIVPVGHPDEAPEATPRKPVEMVVRWM